MKRGVVFVFLFGAALASLVLYAARQADAAFDTTCDRYVVTGGADAGDCANPNQPCGAPAYAVSQASDGDVICIADLVTQHPGPSIYPTSLEVLTRSFTLDGAWQASYYLFPSPHYAWAEQACAPDRVILDAERGGRALAILYYQSLHVRCLTLTGGQAGEATYFPGKGGGVACYQSTLSIENAVITDNYATSGAGAGYGGGIYGEGCNLTLVDSTVANNHAHTTGAGYGGGVYLAESSHAVIHNNIVRNNRSGVTGGGGGGLYLESVSTGIITANMVLSNTAGGDYADGGGIYLSYSNPITLEHNTLRANTASSSNGEGGGLMVNFSNLYLNANLLAQNSAQDGGAIQVFDNQAMTMTNNILVANQGQTSGIAYYCPGGCLGLLYNNTLAQNGQRGIFAEEGAILILFNNIVSSHTVGIEARPTFSNSVAAYHTLFYANTNDTSGATIINQFPITGQNPAFVHPAGLDFHLHPGSPAIDAGYTLAWLLQDFDGDSRPIGGAYDIGADEAFLFLFLPMIYR